MSYHRRRSYLETRPTSIKLDRMPPEERIKPDSLYFKFDTKLGVIKILKEY